MKIKHYILQYSIIPILLVITTWTILFYIFIIKEVYDNIDNRLKNYKILIINEIHNNPNLLNSSEFGINQFKINKIINETLLKKEEFYSDFEYLEYNKEYEPIRILKVDFKAPNRNFYRLTIKASTIEENDLLQDFTIALIVLYLMILTTILLTNNFILKRVWKPFYLLFTKIQDFKLDSNKQFKAPTSHFEEFKTLGNEIEMMLKKNEIIINSQKHFLENITHELQTPLAITINKLELFAEQNTRNKEQINEIASIIETLERLVRLNKSLLTLSKIENKQFLASEMVNFNILIHQIKDDFFDFSEYRNVSIFVKEQGNLNVFINKGLVIILINNLLKNAILYNKINGFVSIIITDKKIMIKNSSLDPPLNSTLIFKRFYRNTNYQKSTGLGLSIVKSIIDNHQAKITYRFENVHIFEIIFKT